MGTVLPMVHERVGRLHGPRVRDELKRVIELVVQKEGSGDAPVLLCGIGDQGDVGGLLNVWRPSAGAAKNTEELVELVSTLKTGFALSSTPQLRLFLRHAIAFQCLIASTLDEANTLVVACLARLGAHFPLLIGNHSACIVCTPTQHTPIFAWNANLQGSADALAQMVASVAALGVMFIPAAEGGFLKRTFMLETPRRASLYLVSHDDEGAAADGLDARQAHAAAHAAAHAVAELTSSLTATVRPLLSPPSPSGRRWQSVLHRRYSTARVLRGADAVRRVHTGALAAAALGR